METEASKIETMEIMDETADNTIDEEELEDLVDQRPPPSSSMGGSCCSTRCLLITFTLLVALGVGVVFQTGGPNGAATWREFQSKNVIDFDNEQEVQQEAERDVEHLTALAKRQLESYKTGTGLMLNLQIAHNGGSALCRSLGHSPTAKGRTPSFACAGITKADKVDTDAYPSKIPWTAEETADNIEMVRKHFHFITWHVSPVGMFQTDWEDPNLLSVIIMRDPMERLLSYDGKVEKKYPGVTTGYNVKDETWEAYAESSYTDNFALANLVSDGQSDDCCDGEHTDREYLKKAKELVERFTIVLDIRCLNEGMTVLAYLTGLEAVRMVPPEPKPSVKDQISNDAIYKKLLKRNKLDIELYEWSKSRSLVKCDTLAK